MNTTLGYLLLLPFFVLGVFLILLGVWIGARMYGKHSVEVDAECVDVSTETVRMGTGPGDYTYYKDARLPVYRYRYNGVMYTSQPVLRSNRRGYRPALGPTTIRVNPEHPERVYSPERKYVRILLVSIGGAYVVLSVILFCVFRYFGVL
ncbi:MAG: DUF3592 domain-containing protein [Clostridiales bacterium]|nr:DUF3592 domain-containing protein [Clostridiales bacterium]